MPVTIGSRIGAYEVLAVIGAGAMGEVYRARDTQLHREVALKVLPAAVGGNPRRLARFEREARALAALNHPNISAMYAVVHDDKARGPKALVMELVEGTDLSLLLERGAMPIADALPIARQIADALAAAHNAGIVHRDLKPANVKVREDGTVKVLDFGLATAPGDSGAGSGDGSGSGSGSGAGSSGGGAGELPPTLTIGAELSAEGAVVGTAAYMAPEQARGTAVDKRADIWAFGVLLFEMIAGRRPFGAAAGLEPAELLAHTLATEPDWHALPDRTPEPVRRLIGRCLAKDRRQRLHDISDARLDIDDALSPASANPVDGREARTRSRTSWLYVGAALLVGLAAGAASRGDPSPYSGSIHARIDVGPAEELNAGGAHPTMVLPAGGATTALAWSPDGRALAFIGLANGVRQVYVRDLASDSARALAGTEGARSLAFSPDGNEIAFAGPDAISRIRVAGGPPARVCGGLATIHGMAWGRTSLLLSHGSLARIDMAATGCQLTALTQPLELVRHASPSFLPGETALVYTEYQKQWTSGDERVMVQALTPGAVPRLLLREAADARYLPTGHLAFLRQGTLFVVPFDARTLEVRGEPAPVIRNIAQSVVAWDSDDLSLAGQFAVSAQGTLAYASSPLATYPDRELVAVDRQGRVSPLGAPRAGYRSHVELSPDGSHLAVSVQTTTDVRVFSYDLRRGSLSRMADSIKGEVLVASWSRDNRIAVQVIDGGKITAALIRPDATDPPVPVAKSTGFWAGSLSPQGRLAGMKEGDIWFYAPFDTAQAPTALLGPGGEERQPMFSPDGAWIAYTSPTTGRPEVYVRPFPGPGEATLVSTNGGTSPAWNPDGRELFYVEAGTTVDRMMAVGVSEPGRPTRPRALFAVPHQSLFQGTAILTPYAVARDGQRFFTVRQAAEGRPPVRELQIILNWFDDLTSIAAARR